MHDQEAQISYRHKDGDSNTRFVQYAKDPLPAWAVDVQPFTAPFIGHIDLRVDVTPYASSNVSAAKLEELKMELRRGLLSYIFAAATTVGIPHDILNIDGTIKIVQD